MTARKPKPRRQPKPRKGISLEELRPENFRPVSRKELGQSLRQSAVRKMPKKQPR